VTDRIDHLRSAAHQLKLLGKSPPEEIKTLEDSEAGMNSFLWMIFNLWSDCQSWDCAGKIRLETIQIVCADHGFEFNSFTRFAVQKIESIYRQVQAEKMRQKNG
jgi:hypothetical protein